jgi:hypothetical protein
MSFKKGGWCTFVGGHKRNTYADKLEWHPEVGKHYKISKVMVDPYTGHRWLLLEGEMTFSFNSNWFRPGKLDYDFVEQLLKSL